MKRKDNSADVGKRVDDSTGAGEEFIIKQMRNSLCENVFGGLGREKFHLRETPTGKFAELSLDFIVLRIWLYQII